MKKKSLKEIYNFLYESISTGIDSASQDKLIDDADSFVPTIDMFAKLILSSWKKGDKGYEYNNDNNTITVRNCFDDQGLRYIYKTPKIRRAFREAESYDDYLIPMDGFVTGDEVAVTFWEVDKSIGEKICADSEFKLKDMVDEDLKHLWWVLKNNIRLKNEKKRFS